jgi:hypothetical protein
VSTRTKARLRRFSGHFDKGARVTTLRSLRVSDETTISFANLSLPQEGVAVVLAEDGPKLSSAAKDLDKESKGLLSRAANISGFKGKKESTVDLLAPAGLKFSRLVLMGTGKTADYSAEEMDRLLHGKPIKVKTTFGSKVVNLTFEGIIDKFKFPLSFSQNDLFFCICFLIVILWGFIFHRRNNFNHEIINL